MLHHSILCVRMTDEDRASDSPWILNPGNLLCGHYGQKCADAATGHEYEVAARPSHGTECTALNTGVRQVLCTLTSIRRGDREVGAWLKITLEV